jgi:hypothetical protein
VSARVVAATRGLHWLAEGWRIFRMAPLGWLAMVFGYIMVTILLSLVPLIGAAAASVLVPVFTVGFMTAGRAALHARSVELPMLFAGFRERVPAQLALGVVYTLGLAAAVAASVLVDGGELLRSLTADAGARAQLDEILPGVAATLAFYVPTMMALWFAPLLVAWHSMSAPKALFFSFAACWLNWRAFAAYGLAVGFIAVVLPSLVLMLLMLVSGGALRVQPSALLFPLMLILLPTLFASYYASYRDVFGAREGEPAQT